MSSGYSTAELERMRKEKLRRDLERSISALREELCKEKDNDIQVLAGTDIMLLVFADDEFTDGSDPDLSVSADAFRDMKADYSAEKEDLDLSALLEKKPAKGRLAQELENWILKVDERPVIEEKDERDRARIIKELSEKIDTADMDIEDKINYVKMRVTSYLQGGVSLTDADKEKIESEYYEYCALCKLLKVKPREMIPYRIRNEIERMTSVLEKRAQEEYIMETLSSIMEELGCHVREEAVLDHTAGVLFSVDEHPVVEVFIGRDNGGIMFEPVGETRPGTLEGKRQLEDSVNDICSMYPVIEERAAEKGVILRRVYREPASADEICVQSDVRERRQSRRKKQARTLSERAMNSEV